MIQKLKYIRAEIYDGKVVCNFISVKKWTKDCITIFKTTPEDGESLVAKNTKNQTIIYCRTGNDLKRAVKNLTRKTKEN